MTLGCKMSTEQVYIASVVAAYWFVCITVFLLNISLKSLLWRVPLFMAWIQCVVTAAICWLCGEVCHRMRKAEENAVVTADKVESDSSEQAGAKTFWHQIPRAEYKVECGQQVFPLSLVFVGMIIFRNLCKMQRFLATYGHTKLSPFSLRTHKTISFLTQCSSCCFAQVLIGYECPSTTTNWPAR